MEDPLVRKGSQTYIKVLPTWELISQGAEAVI